MRYTNRTIENNLDIFFNTFFLYIFYSECSWRGSANHTPHRARIRKKITKIWKLTLAFVSEHCTSFWTIAQVFISKIQVGYFWWWEGGYLHVVNWNRARFSKHFEIMLKYKCAWTNIFYRCYIWICYLLLIVNPFMPTVQTFAVRETDVFRYNGGISGAPLKPLRDDSTLRALSSLRGLRGAPEVPPL